MSGITVPQNDSNDKSVAMPIIKIEEYLISPRENGTIIPNKLTVINIKFFILQYKKDSVFKYQLLQI